MKCNDPHAPTSQTTAGQAQAKVIQTESKNDSNIIQITS